MAESVYKVVELVGTSTESWEKAAKAAVDRVANHCATCALPRSSSRISSSRIARSRPIAPR